MCINGALMNTIFSSVILSFSDLCDRNRLMDFIHTVMNYHRVPLFHSVHEGLEHLCRCLVGNMPITRVPR